MSSRSASLSVAQRRVLRELREVAAQDDVAPLRAPRRFVEVSDSASEQLRPCRRLRFEDLDERALVAEEPRFLGHHPVLCGRVTHAADLERGRMPLAEAVRSDSVLGALGTPEGNEARTLARGPTCA